jgi:hypothetical protein
MRVILGSNSRADNLRGQFPYSPTFAAARDFASVMHPRKPTSASGSYTDRVAAACLSFHAPYRCRHVGVCCETAWDIEVDAPIVAAVSLGRLTPVSVTPSPFTTAAKDVVMRRWGMRLGASLSGLIGLTNTSTSGKISSVSIH